jgi:hypothetical protein
VTVAIEVTVATARIVASATTVCARCARTNQPRLKEAQHEHRPD